MRGEEVVRIHLAGWQVGFCIDFTWGSTKVEREEASTMGDTDTTKKKSAVVVNKLVEL